MRTRQFHDCLLTAFLFCKVSGHRIRGTMETLPCSGLRRLMKQPRLSRPG